VRFAGLVVGEERPVDGAPTAGGVAAAAASPGEPPAWERQRRQGLVFGGLVQVRS
jgi:hypothetical protein